MFPLLHFLLPPGEENRGMGLNRPQMVIFQQLARIKKMHRLGAFSRFFPVSGFDARPVKTP
jgi:hypothetical protein